MGYESAISYLYSLQKHGIKLRLDNPRKLLSLLGDPAGSFRAIHVAGTNGKGSTSAISASILKSEGYSVGLFTSPHLVSFTERIKVNDKEIEEKEIVELIEEIRQTDGFQALSPTFFEIVTAMGFLYFKRKGVDLAVIETGMGGRLDATNMIKPEVSVITSIGYDHKEFLGETLREIAKEKAGIIKHKTPVVIASQEPEVLNVIAERADELNAPLYVSGRDFTTILKHQGKTGVKFDFISESFSLYGLTLPLAGAYQAENAGLAIRATLEVCKGVTGQSIRDGLQDVRWHGRLELINGRILIDGAHNPSAASALAMALRKGFIEDEDKIILIMGMMADKDIMGTLRPLLPLTKEVIFTALPYERAASPKLLKEEAESLGYSSLVTDSISSAISMAMSMKGLILITGSFYLIGEAMEVLGAKPLLKGLRE